MPTGEDERKGVISGPSIRRAATTGLMEFLEKIPAPTLEAESPRSKRTLTEHCLCPAPT